jgi:werner syndrome-like exonuclease
MSKPSNKQQRKLPQWMYKRAAVGNAIKNIVSSNSSENNQNSLNDVEPPIRRLRSNAPRTPEDEKPKKPDIEDLPMVEYDGKIHYLNDFISIAETLDTLIKRVDAMPDGDVPVAFDMEWTFSFKTGPEKASLIQVCLDLDECFLIHLPQLKKLPASLSQFLAHPRVILHGVNIKNDLRKLERDFPIIKADKMIERCIDLGPMYNDVCGSSGRWSMERIVLQTLKLRVDKSRHVRMSKVNTRRFEINNFSHKYYFYLFFINIVASRSINRESNEICCD